VRGRNPRYRGLSPWDFNNSPFQNHIPPDKSIPALQRSHWSIVLTRETRN